MSWVCQQRQPGSCPQTAGSSFSSSASEEEEVFQSESIHQFQTPSPSRWTCPSGHQSSVGGSKGKRDSKVPHINDGSSPLSVFLLYFVEIITLLLVETNRYYHNHLDRLDEGPSPLPYITEAKMLVSWDNNTNGTLLTGQTDSTGQKQDNSTHISIAVLRNGTDASTPSLSALHRQQEWAWHDGWKFWPVMDDMKCLKF